MTANIETVLSSLLAVYTNLPDGSIVIPCGKYPVGTVGGVVGVSTPVLELMVYIEIVAKSVALDIRFATYANLPEGSTAILSDPKLLPFVVTVGGLVGVSAPVHEFTA